MRAAARGANFGAVVRPSSRMGRQAREGGFYPPRRFSPGGGRENLSMLLSVARRFPMVWAEAATPA
jgi:hypothetical protein